MLISALPHDEQRGHTKNIQPLIIPFLLFLPHRSTQHANLVFPPGASGGQSAAPLAEASMPDSVADAMFPFGLLQQGASQRTSYSSA